MCIYFTPVELLAVSLFDGLLCEILLFPTICVLVTVI